MSTIECPNCGAHFNSRGLGSHRKGTTCRVMANVRRATDRGLSVVTAPDHRTLGNHPLIERIEDRITQKDHIGQRVKTGTTLYAPRWLLAIVRTLPDGEERDRLIKMSCHPATREDAEAFGRVLVAAGARFFSFRPNGKLVPVDSFEYAP